MDFEETVDAIGQNVTQLCFMTPSTYIEGRKKFGVDVIVKALRNGKPYQHSVIIAKADRNINSIQELKGRTFAWSETFIQRQVTSSRGPCF